MLQNFNETFLNEIIRQCQDTDYSDETYKINEQAAKVHCWALILKLK